MKTLYVVDGPEEDKTFTLNEGVTTVGRSSKNDISLSDIAISRYHAKLITRGDRVFVVDLGSSRGVFIDGVRIEPGSEVEAREDSSIMIGSTILSLLGESLEETIASNPYPSALYAKSFDKGDLVSRQSEARNYIRSLELLLVVSNALVQSLNLNELFREVMNQVFTLLKRIDRGAILLLNEETGSLEEVVSKTRVGEKSDTFSKISYSRSIVTRAVKQKKPVTMSDTRRVEKADLSESMEQMNVRSVMCVPLIYKEEVRGVIYVDSIGRPEGFRRDDLKLLTSLGNTASVAIENARLYSDLETRIIRRTEQLERARKRLQESESRFRAVFEHMSSGVAILEPRDEGNEFFVKTVNKAAETMDRIKKEDVVNKNVIDVLPGLNKDEFIEMLRRVRRTGTPEDHPPMPYHEGSALSWRRHSAYKLPNEEIVFIYEDMTEQKRAIETQQALQKQLAHSQKMESLGRMAGGVAHNFRNILQAIMGHSQFLQMVYAQDKQIQEITNDVNESVRKGSEFIKSFLKFSRRDAKREMLPLDLKEVLEEIYRIISNTFDNKIRIAISIKGSIPVRGDFSNLSQAFMNICNNARDSMPDGGQLTIEAMSTGEEVVVTISDTGYGFDEATVNRIFDPF